MSQKPVIVAAAIDSFLGRRQQRSKVPRPPVFPFEEACERLGIPVGRARAFMRHHPLDPDLELSGTPKRSLMHYYSLRRLRTWYQEHDQRNKDPG